MQLSTLEAEQDYLAMRVRQEHAACRVVAAHLAKITSMLAQDQVLLAVGLEQAFATVVRTRFRAACRASVQFMQTQVYPDSSTGGITSCP